MTQKIIFPITQQTNTSINPSETQSTSQQVALNNLNPFPSSDLAFTATAPVILSTLDEKLHRNFYKALRESGINASNLPTFDLSPPPEPLRLQINSAQHQGKRPRMEDAHFSCQIEGGFLMGIFDGHGDKGIIANQAAQAFQTSFPKLLKKESKDFKKIFQEICTSIHTNVTLQSGGTTALVCYFDPTSHRLYTSNLGDSEAYIFRKKGDTVHGFPVSIKRNWSSPKDVERARLAYDNPETFKTWSQIPQAKDRYFPYRMLGVNVSRSLGDKSMNVGGKTAISQKPHVTSFQLAEGDLLVMGCDGLWDFTSAQELINTLIRPFWDSPQLAQSILNHALKTSTDNITVLCAQAKLASLEPTSLDSTQSFEDSDSD